MSGRCNDTRNLEPGDIIFLQWKVAMAYYRVKILSLENGSVVQLQYEDGGTDHVDLNQRVYYHMTPKIVAASSKLLNHSTEGKRETKGFKRPRDIPKTAAKRGKVLCKLPLRRRGEVLCKLPMRRRGEVLCKLPIRRAVRKRIEGETIKESSRTLLGDLDFLPPVPDTQAAIKPTKSERLICENHLGKTENEGFLSSSDGPRSDSKRPSPLWGSKEPPRLSGVGPASEAWLEPSHYLPKAGAASSDEGKPRPSRKGHSENFDTDTLDRTADGRIPENIREVEGSLVLCWHGVYEGLLQGSCDEKIPRRERPYDL